MFRKEWILFLFLFLISDSSFLFSEELNFAKENYFIKEGYISMSEFFHYDDRYTTDECQNEIYQLAYMIVKDMNLTSVLDIGCGSGFKLMKFFKNYKTIGLEIEPTLSYLKEFYSDREWMLSDLSQSPALPPQELVIVSDVIEHLMDPDQLLNWICKIPFKVLVISTPERDVIRGKNHCGPPGNIYHIREWNFDEFARYIGSYFCIQTHLSDSGAGQVIVATQK